MTDTFRGVIEAGRELDALVAELVMGEPKPAGTPDSALERQLAGSPVMSPGGCWVNVSRYEDGDVPTWWPRVYSKDIAAAWEVVEAMRQRGYEWTIECEGDTWAARVFGYHGPSYVELSAQIATAAPLAICRAALAALPAQPPKSAVSDTKNQETT